MPSVHTDYTCPSNPKVQLVSCIELSLIFCQLLQQQCNTKQEDGGTFILFYFYLAVFVEYICLLVLEHFGVHFPPVTAVSFTRMSEISCYSWGTSPSSAAYWLLCVANAVIKKCFRRSFRGFFRLPTLPTDRVRRFP